MSFEKHRITYISSDKKLTRLDGDEYRTEHLDLTPYQYGDIVEADIEKGKILLLRFPPGLEPSHPSKAEVEKKLVEEVAQKVEAQYHIVYIGNGKVVLSKGVDGDEISLNLKENALKYYKSFNAGDLVKFSFVDGSSTDIKSLWKVNSDGSRPEKNNQYNQKPHKVVTIGGTINLQNYENLKIEVSGPYESLDDIKKYQDELREICQLFGKDQATRELVNNYCKRVIGG